MKKRSELLLFLVLCLVGFIMITAVNSKKHLNAYDGTQLNINTIIDIYTGEEVNLNQLIKAHVSKGIVFYIDIPGSMDFEWSYIQKVYEKSKEHGFLTIAVMLNHQSKNDTQSFFQQKFPESSFPFFVGVDDDNNSWKQELSISATPIWLIVNEHNEIQQSIPGVDQHIVDSIDKTIKSIP